MLRRRTLLSTGLAAAALGLAACGDDAATTGANSTPAAGGSDAGGSDGGGAAGGGVLSQVTIGGDAGAEPLVEFSGPLTFSSPESEVVTPGTGDAVTAGDTMMLHTMYVDASDGSVLQSAWRGAPVNVITVDEAQIGPDAAAFFQTLAVGARFAMLGTVTDGRGTKYDVVQVSDVVGTALHRAEGAAQPIPEGMPAFTLTDTGAPQLSGAPGTPAPATTQSAVTILGTGPETAAGQTLVMHYTGWKLSDGSQFDSSWDRGEPFSFELGAGQVIQGWDQGLVGRTVGSQVLLVIPPSEAYEKAGNELSTETLIFVADILGAAPAAGS
ncbi:FKBP-type peptidyl-prolyl cis-trans isomerase [Brachybacterium huguangmaarense]